MQTTLASFDIKIVFDNTIGDSEFIPGFGFSTLIYNHFTGNYLLFDTGENPDDLLHNINEFDVEIEDIKKIIISHDHIENSGGLIGIYNRNPDIDIYVPNESFIQYNRKYKEAQVHGILDAIEIEPSIYSTGQIGNYLKEQALLLRTEDEGLVLIVGCAHPGLEEFLFTINDYKKYVKAIIGGFHSFRKYPYLEGVDFIGPCYCSEHSDEIQKRFPEQYQKICVGSSLCF